MISCRECSVAQALPVDVGVPVPQGEVNQVILSIFVAIHRGRHVGPGTGQQLRVGTGERLPGPGSENGGLGSSAAAEAAQLVTYILQLIFEIVHVIE